MSHGTHECSPVSQVTAHTSMSHGIDVECVQRALSLKSWHTRQWVMAHTWQGHDTQVTESWHTYEQVGSHLWGSHVSHVSHMNESWHTRERVGTHVRRSLISHVSHKNKSWHTYERVGSHICRSHVIPGRRLTWFNTLQHTARCCNTLQHTATHCNTLLHTATHCSPRNTKETSYTNQFG